MGMIRTTVVMTGMIGVGITHGKTRGTQAEIDTLSSLPPVPLDK